MDAEVHMYRVCGQLLCMCWCSYLLNLMQLFPSTPTVAIKAPESGIVFQDLDKFVPSCDVVVVVVVIQNS